MVSQNSKANLYSQQMSVTRHQVMLLSMLITAAHHHLPVIIESVARGQSPLVEGLGSCCWLLVGAANSPLLPATSRRWSL